ncbi:MAG: hypothetical protein JWN37_933 [Candidatus Nomurabacteria bacterium]|nr:hypothetical protein [Candidatus Nomurabacteria bacterium]
MPSFKLTERDGAAGNFSTTTSLLKHIKDRKIKLVVCTPTRWMPDQTLVAQAEVKGKSGFAISLYVLGEISEEEQPEILAQLGLNRQFSLFDS